MFQWIINLFKKETEEERKERMRYNTIRECNCCGRMYMVKDGSMKFCSLECLRKMGRKKCD